MSIQTVRAQIRFALEQLKVKNQHHGFEDICREFSRAKICRNILPATGPVSSGGDHGRDFETFKTYLDSGFKTNNTDVFEGISDQGNLFFACSTQKNIVSKIKKDIDSIFAYTNERKPIIYFCIEDIPVSKRHTLQNWCIQTYDIELDIHDGQSLAENLSESDIFWIAEEYLNITADIYPTYQNADETYLEYKNRWISNCALPQNYADFCQIKYGLRRATFHSEHKPDLTNWLNCMLKIENTSLQSLQRKSQYEICVAALRGQNNLDSYKIYFDGYFNSLNQITQLSDLSDACTLLSYCTTAKLNGEFNINSNELHSLSQQLIKVVDNRLQNTTSPNPKCRLLSIKAYSCLLSFVEKDGSHCDIDGALHYWQELVELADQAQFYPIEQLSDVFKRLIPMLGQDHRFLTITDELDKLIAKRNGNHAAAERCRDRAIEYYKTGSILLAIDHLHRAKISWFSEETLKGSLLALRKLGFCYEELGLLYAAKYCFYSSFYIAFDSNRDDTNEDVSQSLFQASMTTYKLGEWYTFFSLMKPTLMAHNFFDHDPQNPAEHESIQSVFQATAIIVGLTKHYWPNALEPIMTVYNKWDMHDYDRDQLNNLMNIAPNFPNNDINAFWNNFSGYLKGKPFSDLGAHRTIHWKALGIDWKVSFNNNYETTAIAEELVAALQIIIADIAHYDLQLLPVNIKLNLSLSVDDSFSIKELPSNDALEWDIGITKYGQENTNNHFQHVFSCVVTILESCTTLSQEGYSEIIKNALGKELLNKAFFAIPFSELFKSLFDREEFDNKVGIDIGTTNKEEHYKLFEHNELSWKIGEGSVYSEDEAIHRIKKRYDALFELMKIIWPKIQSSSLHMPFFQKLHDEGYRDWHIYLIVGNAIASHVANTNNLISKEIESEAEYREAYDTVTWEVIEGKHNKILVSLEIDAIDTELFHIQEKISFMLLMQAWKLSCTPQTPPINAIKKFLIERYKIFEIDTEHVPLFEK